MSMIEMENQRFAETRGKILVLLAEDYTSKMTSVGSIVSALDLTGYSISDDSLTFHLTYLADSGYIRLWRNRDMPGYRRDRLHGAAKPEDIRFGKLLPKGLQLVDGECDADPKVKF